MKKYTILTYLGLIIITIITAFFIYNVFAKNNDDNKDSSDKTLSEVKIVEKKLEDIFNEMNNITFDKYKIKSSNIDVNNKNQENGQKNGQESDQNSESSSSNEEMVQKERSSKSSSSGNNEGEQKNSKQYTLEENGVLISDDEINWEQVKINVEDIYDIIYSMTLDLYQTSVNQQDVKDFNKEYDKLVKNVKDESKQDTLESLSNLYNYFPTFVENSTENEKEAILVKTKNEIFKAYSILETEDWESIFKYVQNATAEYTKLVTDISNKSDKDQYNINKIYIIINELQNSLEMQDKEVFLIKYKNLLEELQNI